MIYPMQLITKSVQVYFRYTVLRLSKKSKRGLSDKTPLNSIIIKIMNPHEFSYSPISADKIVEISEGVYDIYLPKTEFRVEGIYKVFVTKNKCESCLYTFKMEPFN